MPFNSAQISVPTANNVNLVPQGTGAGLFQNVTGSISDELPVIVRNTDATNPVYLGGENVTILNGLILKAGESLNFSCLGTDAATLSAIATGGAVVVAVVLGRQ